MIDVKQIELESLTGLLINIKRPRIWSPFGRHWFSIYFHSDASTYNLDSLLDQPYRFKDRSELYHFIENEIERNDGHLFTVRRSSQ